MSVEKALAGLEEAGNMQQASEMKAGYYSSIACAIPSDYPL